MHDDWFIRGHVPMTKREVRAVSIDALELNGNSLLVDVGAGPGSVSVEAAMLHPGIPVFAMEKNPEALGLIRANAEKAGANNLHVIPGAVPESLAAIRESLKGRSLHAFIGGTSGRMADILDALLALDKDARIVINVVTLETMAAAVSILKERRIEAEIVSVQVAKSQRTGAYHLMKGENPVYVIEFGGRRE